MQLASAYSHFGSNFLHYCKTVLHEFAEPSKSTLRYCLFTARMSLPQSPLICGHIYSCSITPWSDFCPWYHRPIRAESSEWLELVYHQAFGKFSYNISARCACSTPTNEHYPSIRIVTGENWSRLPMKKYSRRRWMGGVTSHLKDTTHTGLVWSGKIKSDTFECTL